MTPPYPWSRALGACANPDQGAPQRGVFWRMASAPAVPPVPFCSATRSLRDRAPGLNYQEQSYALVQWVAPEELRKRKSVRSDTTCALEIKACLLFTARFPLVFACYVDSNLTQHTALKSHVQKLTPRHSIPDTSEPVAVISFSAHFCLFLCNPRDEVF